MRALALTMILLPSVALAQLPAPPPLRAAAAALPPPAALPADAADTGECTVTTTVRCTGAAAPYAVQAAQPQAPVVIQAPPPVAARRAPPPQIILDPRQLGGDGWRVVQIAGRLLVARAQGLDRFAGGVGHGHGVLARRLRGRRHRRHGRGRLQPVRLVADHRRLRQRRASTSGSAQALWAIDGLAQAGGFVTFLVGLAAGPDKMERLPLSVGPASFAGGGSGVALAGRF